MFVVVVVAALLVAQGEGEGEADPPLGEGEGEGEDPCTPQCDGDVLRFCDFGAAATLVCADVDANVSGETCGLLSAEWGFDCLLPDGAACDPGFGFGQSRCAGGACIDQVCATGEPLGEPVLEPTQGTDFVANTAPTSDSCLGCPQTSLVGPLPLLGLWRARRRRGRGENRPTGDRNPAGL